MAPTLLSATITALLLSTTGVSARWTGHAAKECRKIEPRSHLTEIRQYPRIENGAGNCFTSLDVCMDYYHPDAADMFITLTNKAHNAFVCFTDDKGWRQCVQTSAGVPCNVGVPIGSWDIAAELHLTMF